MDKVKMITRKVNKVLEGYENKPAVTILYNGANLEIDLNEGHYQARQEVEEAFSKSTSFVSNRPTGKRIGLK